MPKKTAVPQMTTWGGGTPSKLILVDSQDKIFDLTPEIDMFIKMLFWSIVIISHPQQTYYS